MFTLRNKGKKQSGFTLMELLIVIAILGLLLGLIAPRLGGITAGTADNVCDTNNKGIRGMTALFLETEGSLPGGLTNMVIQTGAATGTFPVADADNTGMFQDSTFEGEDVVSSAFTQRIFPGLYTLSQADLNELRAMGVSDVHHLRGWDGTVARNMYSAPLALGDEVMMVGVQTGTSGDAELVNLASGGYGDASTSGITTMVADDGVVGNPTWIGRIVMSVSEKCDLVTTGLITASALCPTAVLNADKFTHDEFFIILPRLSSNAAEIAALIPAGTEYVSQLVDGDAADPNGEILQVAGNDAFNAGQEAWQFEVACPEGHKWPAADHENWIVVAP